MKKIVYTSLILIVSAIILTGGAWAKGKKGKKKDTPFRVAKLEDTVAELEATVAKLKKALAKVQMNPVLDLGPYVYVDEKTKNSLEGPHVIFHGINLHVVNDQDQTGAPDITLNGLGNLIVGYNEVPQPPPGGLNR